MTVGTDGIWSARFWVKTADKEYTRYWCKSVRIVGKGLKINYCDDLAPPPEQIEEFTRTLSAWGELKQADIERLKVGIVGIGSVGSIVSEALVKTGVLDITLIDFDRIKRKNIDRLQFVSAEDIGRLKIEKYKEILLKSAPREGLKINALPYSISEELGLKAALDCDVIFSCVDRPLARYVLNSLSYANLIPVIDGGIDASINQTKTNIDQARWRAYTVGVHRRCLKCHQQFNEQDVGLEMEGLLDDPVYISGLAEDHHLRRGENVFAFSLSLASMLIQQFLSLVLQPRGVYYGGKEMDFTTGNIDACFKFECEASCGINDLICVGDKVNHELIISHSIAEESRESV
jgi:molybdopterin-synthase adenylyltransferase